MTPYDAVALLFGCLVVACVAWLKEPQRLECSPDCNHCPAWRREQAAIKAANKVYAPCPLCFKRHKPNEPHQF